MLGQSAAPEIGRGWREAVGTWLQTHKTYPDAARREGQEGVVTVRFTMARDGRVLAFDVLRGSGSAALDEAVGQMLRGARLPPLPEAMRQPEITMTVRIRFGLER